MSRRGRLRDPIDELLAARGLSRRVVAAVGTTAGAMHVVRRGDHVLTIPEATWRPLIDVFGLVVEPFPAPMPRADIVCAWHQRHDSDPAHAWLRDQVRAALAEAGVSGP